MAAACSAALHIVGQKCCDDESAARMATSALGEEVGWAEVRQVEWTDRQRARTGGITNDFIPQDC